MIIRLVAAAMLAVEIAIHADLARATRTATTRAGWAGGNNPQDVG